VTRRSERLELRVEITKQRYWEFRIIRRGRSGKRAGTEYI
jgi:hypothetical protein